MDLPPIGSDVRSPGTFILCSLLISKCQSEFSILLRYYLKEKRKREEEKKRRREKEKKRKRG
jgi:hypothetical protein